MKCTVNLWQNELDDVTTANRELLWKSLDIAFNHHHDHFFSAGVHVDVLAIANNEELER